MLVRFVEIPPQGMTLEIADQSWFPDRELTRHGAARAAVTLSREGERVLCAGWLEVAVDLFCDRCLEPCRHQVTGRFRLRLEPTAGESIPAGEREYHCRPEEMDTVFLPAESAGQAGQIDQVDLTDLLTQQFYLSLPGKSLCRPECRGLCPGCGVDLNRRRCACQAGPDVDSPFAALRALKKQ